MLRVVCIDPNRTFRELLAGTLEREPDVTCVGHTDDVDVALSMVRDEPADVILLNTSRSGPDTLRAINSFKRSAPGARVVILGSKPDIALLVRSAAQGADGFVDEASSVEELLVAIRSDTIGLTLNDRLLGAVRQFVRTEGSLDGMRWNPLLTNRERDVLGLMAEGLDPQAIARQLGLTPHTVRSYVRNVLVKLGAHSQLEAVTIAAKAGLVSGLCSTCNSADAAEPALERVV